MSKSLKLKNDIYIDSSSIVQDRKLLPNVLNSLIRLKKFKIVFDVSSASVGDYVVGYTKNNIPTVSGMTQIGFFIDTIGYADKNFILTPQWRNYKVYAKLFLGYKENKDKDITASGYIVYAKPSLIESGTLE